MWAIAYVALLRPGALVGEILFGAMLLCLLVGGHVGGLATGAGWRAGAGVGLVSALFNLLIVGSLLGEAGEAGGRLALWWVPGTLLGSVALGAIGGATAGAIGPRSVRDRDWYATFAKFAVGAVFLLLISGGIVTGKEAGLAVPDWPGSFGHNMLLFPLTRMVSPESLETGVHYEHAHRLYGMLVGLTAITLLGVVIVRDRRTWVRVLASVILLAVIVQGILGGTRVTERHLGLAILHGVFAQVVLSAFAVLAAVMSTTWRAAVAEARETAPLDRLLSGAAVGLLVAQLGLGASFRHLSASESTADPTLVTSILHLHLAFAFVVAAGAGLAGIRAWATSGNHAVLKRTGAFLTLLIAGQLVLGFAAFIVVLWREGVAAGPTAIPWYEVAITTAHQATGAAILVAAALLATWTRRLLIPAAQEVTTIGPGRDGASAPAGEAVV